MKTKQVIGQKIVEFKQSRMGCGINPRDFELHEIVLENGCRIRFVVDDSTCDTRDDYAIIPILCSPRR